MSEMYDVVARSPRGGGVKIGVMFVGSRTSSGDITLLLNAMPLTNEDGYCLAFIPTPRRQTASADVYDLIAPVPSSNGKTFWLKVGELSSNGAQELTASFDVVPLQDEQGKIRVLARLPDRTTESRHAQDRKSASPNQRQGLGSGQASQVSKLVNDEKIARGEDDILPI